MERAVPTMTQATVPAMRIRATSWMERVVPTMTQATVPAMGIRATSWMERAVPTMTQATVPAMSLARVPVRVPAREATTVPVAVLLTAKPRKSLSTPSSPTTMTSLSASHPRTKAVPARSSSPSHPETKRRKPNNPLPDTAHQKE